MLRFYKSRYFYLVTFLLLTIWFSLNWAVGFFVTQGFSEALRCKVTIDSTHVGLFPLRARANNVRIFSESETEAEGIWIKEVLIRLDFWRIFKKQINLRSLTLNGANIISTGTDSSFFRLLKVVTADSVESPGNKWHSFITDGWRVHLVDLIASSYGANDRPHLILNFDGSSLKFNNIVYTLDDKDVVEDPYKSTAKAESFRVESKLFPNLEIGECDVAGVIGAGKIEFTKIKISEDLESPKPFVSVLGQLNLDEGDFYQLQLDGEITSAHLLLLLGETIGSEYRSLAPTLKVSAAITGQGYSPRVEAKVVAVFNSLNIADQNGGCVPNNMSFDVLFVDQQFYIKDIAAAGLNVAGQLTLSLTDGIPITATAAITLDPKSAYFQECIHAGLDKNEVIWSWIKELPKIPVNFDFTGLVSPLTGQGGVRANLNRERLLANFSLSGNSISGMVSQQLGDNEDKTANVEFNYDLLRHDFRNLKISLNNYLVSNILPIISPLLADAWRNGILAVITPQTVINLAGEFKTIFSADASGKLGFEIAKLTYLNNEIDTLKGAFLIKQQEYSLENVEATSAIALGKGGLKGDFAGKINGMFVLDLHQLGKVPAWEVKIPALSGQAKIEANIAGTLSSPTIDLMMNAQTAFVDNPTVINRSNVTLKITPDKSEYAAELLDRKASITGTISKEGANKKFIMNTIATDFPLLLLFPPHWQGAIINSGTSLNQKYGLISGSVKYGGDILSPLRGKGEVRITDLIIPDGGSVVDKKRPLAAELETGKLKFSQVVLSNEGRDLVLTGDVGENGWKAKLVGQWDIATLFPPLAAVEQINGELQAGFDITGPVREPKVNGKVQLSNGLLSFRIRDTIIGARDVRGKAVFHNENFRIETLEGLFGNAKIVGQGEVQNIFNRDLRKAYLSLKFDNAFLEPIEDLSLTCSGVVSMAKAALTPAVIEGELKISNLLYRHNINLSQLVKAVKEFILGSSMMYQAQGSLYENKSFSDNKVNLALKIIAPNNINIETTYLRAQLKGDLEIGGDIDVPKIAGAIDSINGEFGFQANRFELLSGGVRFSPTGLYNDAKLDIIGETQVMAPTAERYMVKMIIGGTMLTPIVSFSSNSGLSEKEIVGLLGLDAAVEPITIIRQLTGISKDERNGWLTLFSPASVLTLGEKISEIAGFSNISVANTLSPSTGEQSAKVVATRSLTNNMQLVVQSELSSRDDSKVTVDYSITPFLSFVSGWQSRSEFDQNQKSQGGVVAGFRYRKSFPSFGLLLERRPLTQ